MTGPTLSTEALDLGRAWLAWDRRPGDPTAATVMESALQQTARVERVRAGTLRELMVAGRRAGRPADRACLADALAAARIYGPIRSCAPWLP